MTPRFNVPRIGRVKVAQGLDAVDGAFSTIYGEVQFKWFEVWAYQVNPRRSPSAIPSIYPNASMAP